MKEKLFRYCGETDGRVEVTQEWVDNVTRHLLELIKQREEARRILNRVYLDENNIFRVPK